MKEIETRSDWAYCIVLHKSDTLKFSNVRVKRLSKQCYMFTLTFVNLFMNTFMNIFINTFTVRSPDMVICECVHENIQGRLFLVNTFINTFTMCSPGPVSCKCIHACVLITPVFVNAFVTQ